MKRFFYLTYAAIGYLLGTASLLYLAGFLIDFGVPKGINDGDVQPIWISLPIDALLVFLFGLHHSATARSAFKRWLTRWVPQPLERATYIYMSSAMTALLVWLWQPVPITLWQVTDPSATAAILAAYAATWLTMLAATCQFGHFGFMGLQQAWDSYRDRSSAAVPFTARYLYALVRHPIGLSWMLMPWFTPHMTAGQLLWAVSITAYILLANQYEEAELVREIGDDYRQYQIKTPKFVPMTKP